MSRRCKAGQRARIIGGDVNHGKIVVVVRPYFGEVIKGADWPDSIVFPWVVASLSGPMRSFFMDNSEAEPDIVIVVEDQYLDPIPDDSSGLDEYTEVDKPVSKPRVIPV